MNGEGWQQQHLFASAENLEIRAPGIIDFSQDVGITLKFRERRRRNAVHRTRRRRLGRVSFNPFKHIDLLGPFCYGEETSEHSVKEERVPTPGVEFMVPERQVVLGPVEVAKVAEGQVRSRAIALANEQPAGDCPRHAAVPIREGVKIRQTRKRICREHGGRHFVATVANVFGQNSEDHLGTMTSDGRRWGQKGCHPVEAHDRRTIADLAADARRCVSEQLVDAAQRAERQLMTAAGVFKNIRYVGQ